ncbi:transcription intermediary factor 1-alpha-like isoform X1 [Mercenaria mercenaria]|uniref:transcription intermediary factor 1-alpha-like isoform X1 n=2 Tax=Mercenaria mercenaria TaxID=6596 RepID=UPI00234E9F76|nr:transcription intermediary factor 1-alpha-like isoform X1 [Mercenaria mercenaria]
MATGGCEVTSDELINFKCTPCAELNKTKQAVKYCVQCQGYCCQTCVDTHRVFPTLKGHTLVDKLNLKSQLVATELPVVPTETCSTHGIKILDMYCENHDVVGCTSCIALDHRSCSDVHLIPDVIDNLLSKSDAGKMDRKLQDMKMTMKEIKTKRSCADVQSIPDIVDSKFQTTDDDKIHQMLQDLKMMMEKTMNIRQRLIEDLKKSKTEAVIAINDFRKEMETILEQLEKESIKELEMKFIKEESKLLEEKKNAETELDGLKQAVNDLKKSEGNKAQQFVSMKMSLKSIAKTEDVSSSLQTSVDANISFSFDPAILDFLQQLKTFGSVRHVSTTDSSSPRSTVYSVKRIENLNIRVQNDKNKCLVYGSCLTEDRSLLLADYSNNNIKRANIAKMSVTDYCCVPDGPYGVCCTSKSEAAVCFNNTTFQFVSIGK